MSRASGRSISRSQSRSKVEELLLGAALGFTTGLVAAQLDFATLVSFHGDRTRIVLGATALGSAAALAGWRRLLAILTSSSVALWLVVASTSLTHWMGAGLVRSEPPRKADAVFVLASGLQADGELSTVAMSRLLLGLELLGQGWAPRLVLSELAQPSPRYRDAACELMDRLGMSNEVLVVGPVADTHDEAVAVGELARDFPLDRVLVVTSPSHSRRASAALEKQGVKVVSVPSVETQFDYQGLSTGRHGDDRIRAFGPLLHEYVGLLYYRLRGWLPS
jgi:uncharacterized SAM-binding protein YcdF (DUF218 family)